MYLSTLACLYLWLLAAIAHAAPGGKIPIDSGAEKNVCSFLGGTVMNIKQTDNAQGTTKEPAIRTVSAGWNVPWMKARPGVDLQRPENRHLLAQWVGILGNACDKRDWYPFLQAGTAIKMDEKGTTTAYAWVEWFPAASHSIPTEKFIVNPGDRIRVVVDVYTRITGHVYMKNMRTGQAYDEDVTADSPRDPRFSICLGDGTAQFFQEWAIMDDRADLPIFNNVTFSNVMAQDRRGKSFDFNMGTQDYWNMTDADRQVAVPVEMNENTFVLYSPEGIKWDPIKDRY